MKNLKFLIIVLSAFSLVACSTCRKKETPTEEKARINDFPTQERVDYVMTCIAKHGGLTYINQYACSCKVDKIAEKMTFADYEQARTYGFLRGTAGEAGGVFRDPKESKRLKKLITEAEAYAERMCFVK